MANASLNVGLIGLGTVGSRVAERMLSWMAMNAGEVIVGGDSVPPCRILKVAGTRACVSPPPPFADSRLPRIPTARIPAMSDRVMGIRGGRAVVPDTIRSCYAAPFARSAQAVPPGGAGRRSV